MWLKATDGTNDQGRVNGTHVESLTVTGSGNVWAIYAEMVSGAQVRVSADYGGRAAALSAVDDMVLGG